MFMELVIERLTTQIKTLDQNKLEHKDEILRKFGT